MLLSIAWAALRRRPFSTLLTLLLGVVWSGLLGVPAPAAVLVWLCLALLGLGAARAVEPAVLRRLGGRQPSRLERERLASALRTCGDVRPMVVDQAAAWLYPSLRHVVLSRGLLDLLEERELVGLVAQAAAQQRLGSLAGESMVWLGNTFLLGAWLAGGWLVRLGQLLAAVIGVSLVLPALLWPDAFRARVGRVLGWVLIGLVGTVLIVEGFPALGMALLLARPLVLGMRVLLAWESRRAEARADRATVEAGLGWYLLDALETLGWSADPPRPTGALGVLQRPGSPLPERMAHVWQRLEAERKA